MNSHLSLENSGSCRTGRQGASLLASSGGPARAAPKLCEIPPLYSSRNLANHPRGRLSYAKRPSRQPTKTDNENCRKQLHEKTPLGVPRNLVVFHRLDILDRRAWDRSIQPQPFGCPDHMRDNSWPHHGSHQPELSKLLLGVLTRPAALLSGIPNSRHDTIVPAIAVSIRGIGVADGNLDSRSARVVLGRDRLVFPRPLLTSGSQRVSLFWIVALP